MSVVNAVIAIKPIAGHDEVVESCDRLRRAFERCADGLFRFILVRVASDRNVAEDLLQQTCQEAVGSRNLPDGDDACEAWLFGIARNLMRRHWRKHRRAGRRVSLEEAKLATRLADDMEARPLPADDLIRRESVEQLLLAITALQSADQSLIFAFYYDGRSQSEIAEAMCVSTKSVETRLYRVRQRLRASLRNLERTY